MEKKKWGTLTKICFGLSIAVDILGLFGVGTMLAGLMSMTDNPNITPELHQQATVIMSALFVIILLVLAATIWLIKTKSPKALYTLTGIFVLNMIVSLLGGEFPKAAGALLDAVIIWLLCRKVVFDIE